MEIAATICRGGSGWTATPAPAEVTFRGGGWPCARSKSYPLKVENPLCRKSSLPRANSSLREKGPFHAPSSMNLLPDWLAMAEPLRPEVQEFDLTSEALRVDRIRLRRRIILVVAAGGLAVEGVVFLLLRPTLPSLFAAGILWAGSGICLFVLVRFLGVKAPLKDVQITPEELRLHFEDQSEIALRWDSPQFGLTLRDYSINLFSTKAEKRHVVLSAPQSRFGTVPHEVAGAIVQAARQHSLSVAVRKEVLVEGKAVFLTITTRIGRIEGTPDWEGHETPAT